MTDPSGPPQHPAPRTPTQPAPEPEPGPQLQPAPVAVPAPAPALYPPPPFGQPLPGQASTVWAVPAQLVPGPRRERPWLRTALRWTAAAAVFVAVGVGTAVGVMAPPRTDLPGLKSPSDQRYVFPALKLPALPPGALGPNEENEANGSQVHLADLRQLLLPAPVGARPDTSFPGASGWYPVSAYAAKFTDSGELRATFADSGLRHIAATAWTGPDGTRTEVYLLAFRSPAPAAALFTFDSSNSQPVAEPEVAPDPEASFPGVDSNAVTAEVEPKAPGDVPTAMAFLNVGDVEAFIVMTNPNAVVPATFTQVVALQNELLQG